MIIYAVQLLEKSFPWYWDSNDIEKQFLLQKKKILGIVYKFANAVVTSQTSQPQNQIP